MISGIYKIENKINHCIYVGKAKDIQNRWRQHKWAAKKNNQTHLYRAIRKYGIENFDFFIIETMDLKEYIKNGSKREKYWIKYYNTYLDPKHYNETEGGEGTLGWVPSQEWKNKQSKIKKEWYKTKQGLEKAKKQSKQMTDKPPLRLNKKHTKKWKQQHSQDMQGNKNPNYGKHTQGKRCLCIELNKIFESTREAEKIIGVNHTGIAAACRGAQKTAGGYHWKYIQ
jgi:group I intron endonuclease